MWGYDIGWGGMLLISFGMVLWIALLVVLVWAVIRWLERRTTRPGTPATGTPSSSPSALEILQQRYARGEIDTATYEEMRERLVASGAREKLGVEMEPYLILGACNPVLAQRALEQEPEIGLLLPCNVVIRTVESGCRVEIADPEAMLGMVGNEQLDAIAGEAKQRLQRVVAALEG